jgi:hypothetical protein
MAVPGSNKRPPEPLSHEPALTKGSFYKARLVSFLFVCSASSARHEHAESWTDERGNRQPRLGAAGMDGRVDEDEVAALPAALPCSPALLRIATRHARAASNCLAVGSKPARTAFPSGCLLPCPL